MSDRQEEEGNKLEKETQNDEMLQKSDLKKDSGLLLVLKKIKTSKPPR